MKLIFGYIRRHLGTFLAATLFLVAEAVCDLLQPTIMSGIVDNGVAHADVGLILRYGGAMLGVALLGALAACLRNVYSNRTSQRIGRELRGDMYHTVQTLSLENIDRLQPASIITRITNDVTQVQEFINSLMRMMVKAPITCVGAVILIVLQTPRQSPVLLCILLIVALLIFGNLRVGYPRFRRLQKMLERLNTRSREFLASIRVVKAFNAQEREEEKFDEAASSLAQAGTEALRAMAVFAPLINLTVNFGILLLLWRSRSQNSAQIGRLMASVNYMTQVLFALGMISNTFNVAARAMASADRIREVLDEQPAQKVPREPLCPLICGGIEFRDVSFAYAGSSEQALHGVSFRVQPGETIGIIGPTGAGKTTLVNLVPRFYDAAQGAVLVDGCDVTQIDEKILRGAVAVVPQKALLFTGSIGDNLRWGRRDADDAEIQAAARVACADEFIAKTENGYGTQLGQGGVNLSGGQKQRLCLARALVRNPRILILDDCTSALDAGTEAQVLARLRRREERATVLLISQKISSVMRADRILCLEEGRVQGFGTHAELMEHCPTYRAIYTSQIGGGEDGR